MRLRVCAALWIACGCEGSGPIGPKLTVAIKTSARALGSVTAASGGSSLFNCSGGTCAAEVVNGTAVSLTAAPADAGSLFAGWSGDCAGASPTCTVTMEKPMSVTARFRPNANIVFTTSTQLAMPFGATADAAQAAADSFCSLRASTADLPGQYVAWLSTSTKTAISKLGGANGWIRTDGRPFANTKADLAAGRIYYPPAIGENAFDVGGTFYVAATGTGADGTALGGGTCNDWTSTAGTTAGTGVPSGGSHAWTQAPYGWPCSGPFVLYCLETSLSVPVVPAATGRIAFVSKGTLTPGPGKSRADADAICQSEAQAAGLPGPFTDYLALLATTGESALARFPADPALPPWVRPDGVALVARAADLVGSSALLAPIDVTADETYVAGGPTWTGSLGPQLRGDAASTCNDWSSTANSGNGGQIEYTFHWFDEYQNSITCLAAERVYCFQK